MEYMVELTIETSSPLTDAVLESVASVGGPAGGTVGQRRLVTVLTVKAPGVAQAVQKAADLVLARAPGEVIAADASTVDEADRRAEARIEFVGVAEVAELLGISRQRVVTLSKRDDFPAPVQRLTSGPIWRRGDLSTFEMGWQRKGGRPTGSPEQNEARDRRILELKGEGLTQVQIAKQMKVSQSLVSVVLNR